MTFENQGNSGKDPLYVRAERPPSFDWALILSVAMWFFGVSADAFYRLCSPVKWIKKKLGRSLPFSAS